MSLVEKVRVICREQLDDLAAEIESELKAECPKQTGEAASAIHIETPDENTRLIGGTNTHLFFADQGNNQSKRIIYPVRAKALRFTDGSFHGSASTYEGKHFVREVANRHR